MSAPTATRTCPHCGKPFTRREVTLPGFGPVDAILPCDCEGAVADRKRAEEEERQRLIADAFAGVWQRAGIPEEFAHVGATWDHVDALEDGRSLYLTGDVGRGKTHLACQVARGWLARQVRKGGRWPSLRFVTAQDVLAQFRYARDRWDVSEEDVYSRLSGVGLLVLDDLGKGVASEWAFETMFRIIDERLSNRRPMVITTQYATAELASRYGKADPGTIDALLSRLRGDRVEGVTLTGPDRRLAC